MPHAATPIPSRRDLPALLTRLGLVRTGVELGVARGTYSAHLLANCPVRRLYSIDAWAGDRGHDLAQCEKTTRRLAPYGARSIVLRARFDEALALFPDHALDFLYLDGYAHTGNQSGRTLLDWWPKVRPGGLVAGHDYAPRWPRNVAAVDAFLATARIPAERFVLTEEDEHPSWIVLPPAAGPAAGADPAAPDPLG
ncbi:MAG: class I SAM-dependent methyltransferase [Verrucomicrobiales bacterium]